MFFVVYICSVANEKKRFFEMRGRRKRCRLKA